VLRDASAVTSCTQGVAAGNPVSGSEAPIKPGNALPLRNVPVGSTIHCIEMLPGKARIGTLSRYFRAVAGARRQLRTVTFALRRIRKVAYRLQATLGEVGIEHSLRSIGRLVRCAGAVSVQPGAVW